VREWRGTDRSAALKRLKTCRQGLRARHWRRRFHPFPGRFDCPGHGHPSEALRFREVLRIAQAACSSQINEVAGALGTGIGDTSAAWPLRASSNEKGPVSWPLAKPSPGLEPGAASLPWRLRPSAVGQSQRASRLVFGVVMPFSRSLSSCSRDALRDPETSRTCPQDLSPNRCLIRQQADLEPGRCERPADPGGSTSRMRPRSTSLGALSACRKRVVWCRLFRRRSAA
jgi:hypothetical protein